MPKGFSFIVTPPRRLELRFRKIISLAIVPAIFKQTVGCFFKIFLYNKFMQKQIWISPDVIYLKAAQAWAAFSFLYRTIGAVFSKYQF